MNKNSTPIILLILALGIYFTFTKGKIDDLKTIKNVNAGYQQAINNSSKLMKIRDDIKKDLNKINPNDMQKLNKILPDNIDNVRLTLDVKSIGMSRGLILKNVRTDAANINTGIKSPGTTAKPANSTNQGNDSGGEYDIVTLSFGVTTTYPVFLELLRDLETSMRILDISKVSFTANNTGVYDYSVELKTYWLRQ